MRVLHCCLAAFYIDDFGYQENILPRIHKEQGHSVEILASTETYVDQVTRAYCEPRRYLSNDGIWVTRLPYRSWLPSAVARKLRLYQGLEQAIERFDPDVIFLHDCQFLDIGIVARRAASRHTTVFVDSHTDWVNSGRSWLSREVLHGIIYKACARRIEPWARRFFATLPTRADFLKDVYGIPDSKIELLPFGADDSRIRFDLREERRQEVRRELRVPDAHLVFVTGGKIDHRKNIHLLVDAFIRTMERCGAGGAVLVIFGKPEAALTPLIEEASRHPAIRYVGWVPAERVHWYLWAADVAVFPGTHSVLWEEAVGLGVPCVFKRWPGIEHVQLGGNCLMLDTADQSSLESTLQGLIENPGEIERMRIIAESEGRKRFSYTHIARLALGELAQVQKNISAS